MKACGNENVACTQTRVVMPTRIKRCKRLLKYCWRPLQLGGQWQIPFLQCAYAATAAFAWISTEIELVCAVPAWVFPRKNKAIRSMNVDDASQRIRNLKVFGSIWMMSCQ